MRYRRRCVEGVKLQVAQTSFRYETAMSSVLIYGGGPIMGGRGASSANKNHGNLAGMESMV